MTTRPGLGVPGAGVPQPGSPRARTTVAADRTGLRLRLALAGLVAAGAALATGELSAGLVAGIPSPVLAVGRLVIDYQPPGAKDLVTNLFGTNDKLALQIVVAIAALAIGAGLGLLAARRVEIAAAVIAAFAALGFVASLRDPDSIAALAVIAAGVEGWVGIMVLRHLVGLAVGGLPGSDASGAAAGSGRQVPSGRSIASGRPVAANRPPASVGAIAASRARSARRAPTRAGSMPDWSRRAFLIRSGGLAATAVAATAVGRTLFMGQRTPTSSGPIPVAANPATLPAGADLSTADLSQAGLSPIVVPNDAFYRIDTALIPPNVDRDTWHLKVTGMVDRPIELTYAELIQLPIIEQFVTIACVSNQVGGNLVGNAAWRGVPLRTVLDMAGVQAGATQLVGRSVDGFTVGMPTAWVQDPSRVPMIAIGMNGQPLPREHGYPARLIVPGLYGYVSATKWVTELELTTLEAFDAYWVPLGWAKEAPILTQSRIDLPRDGEHVSAGRVPIAGVAWAPDRGISKVEVSIDGGDWQAATISAPISNATWVQWLYEWTAKPGGAQIEVRATDRSSAVQTADRTPPAPDGARGHHHIQVSVG